MHVTLIASQRDMHRDGRDRGQSVIKRQPYTSTSMGVVVPNVKNGGTLSKREVKAKHVPDSWQSCHNNCHEVDV